jgi:hypothetical protein
MACWSKPVIEHAVQVAVKYAIKEMGLKRAWSGSMSISVDLKYREARAILTSSRNGRKHNPAIIDPAPVGNRQVLALTYITKGFINYA